MAFASAQTANLMRLAETYAAHEFRTLEAVSGMVKGKGGFFAALKRGGDCTTASSEAVLGWFDGHWPIDLAWPQFILRPTRPGKALLPSEVPVGMTEADAEFLMGLTNQPIWPNGRRPPWWHDMEVREFLTRSHRQMSLVRCQKMGAARFGGRCPKKAAIHLYWMRLDTLTAVSKPKKEAA